MITRRATLETCCGEFLVGTSCPVCQATLDEAVALLEEIDTAALDDEVWLRLASAQAELEVLADAGRREFDDWDHAVADVDADLDRLQRWVDPETRRLIREARAYALAAVCGR